MTRTIWIGAVAYDPKVVTIWEGMRRYFHEEAHLPVEVVLFQSYEAQVYALLAGSDVERCGCLLLQRFGKVAGALAQLRQQPSIFNTSGDPLCPAHRRNQSKRSRCSAQPTSPARTLYWSSGIRATRARRTHISPIGCALSFLAPGGEFGREFRAGGDCAGARGRIRAPRCAHATL